MGSEINSGYRVEVSFDSDYLRSLNLVQEGGKMLIGLFRADALSPESINWYTLVDPHIAEPDFHIPATLFPYSL